MSDKKKYQHKKWFTFLKGIILCCKWIVLGCALCYIIFLCFFILGTFYEKNCGFPKATLKSSYSIHDFIITKNNIKNIASVGSLETFASLGTPLRLWNITDVKFNHDGSQLVIMGKIVWVTGETCEAILLAQTNHNQSLEKWHVSVGSFGKNQAINSASSPDKVMHPFEPLALTVNDANIIQFWDTATNSIVHKIPFDTHINSIHFSPNGKLFVVISAYHGSVYDSVSIWGINNSELTNPSQ